MRRILLVSLPLLTLLGCGSSKKEKNLPSENPTVTPTATPTAETSLPNVDSKNDVPAVTPSTSTPGGGTTNTTPSTTPSTNDGSGKGSTPGGGKDNPVQNPSDDGKGSSTECEMHVIDFDKKPDGQGFGPGEKIKEQYRAWGVRFEGYRRNSSNNYESGEAIIFDSAARPDDATKAKYLEISKRFGNSDGFDADLTTSQNKNVLIIAEHTYDINPNDGIDWVTYPDDNVNGGKIKLYFDKPTKVIDMDFVASNGKDSEVKLFDGPNDSDEIYHQAIPLTDASVVKKLTVGSSEYLAKFKIILNGGGAVDNIRICVKK